MLLVGVVFTGALPLLTALAFTLSAFLAGPLMAALASLVPTRRGIAWQHFFNAGLRDVLRSSVASAWQFSQLFVQAGLMFDAMARALWRMLLSRKHLLEWTTAAQAQASAKYTLSAFSPSMRRHPFFAWDWHLPPAGARIPGPGRQFFCCGRWHPSPPGGPANRQHAQPP
ncbi:hypothetical protein LP417_25505 [Polaromonas sp. P1-6]|nr:hypothetical protein LP417_25505 [Polaromonas sp. P1-6]